MMPRFEDNGAYVAGSGVAEWRLDLASAARRRARRIRRTAGRWAIRQFVEGLAGALGALPWADPQRNGVEVIRDVAYGDAGRPEHRLDVYRPIDLDPNAPPPAVLYLHGGGFSILSKDTHWIMGLLFARRGYVVFNANYSLAPLHAFPAGLRDACRAYSWVAANAERYGAHPRRIILAGESAGANLAACLTLSACYQRPEQYAREIFDLELVPQAVVAACGLFEVSNPERFVSRADGQRGVSTLAYDRIVGIHESYLGGSAALEGSDRALADPLIVLEGASKPCRPLPPFFLPVGDRDPLVDDTERMHAALRRQGARSRMRHYHGGGHAFHTFVWNRRARQCWNDTFAFLAEAAGGDAGHP